MLATAFKFHNTSQHVTRRREEGTATKGPVENYSLNESLAISLNVGYQLPSAAKVHIVHVVAHAPALASESTILDHVTPCPPCQRVNRHSHCQQRLGFCSEYTVI